MSVFATRTLDALSRGKAFTIALGLLMNEEEIRNRILPMQTPEEVAALIKDFFSLTDYEAEGFFANQLFKASDTGQVRVDLSPSAVRSSMPALNPYSPGSCPSRAELMRIMALIHNQPIP